MLIVSSRSIYTKFIALIVLPLGIASLETAAFGQSLADGWNGIKPLVTSKGATEKILGKPTSVTKDVFYFYETGEASFRFKYSSEPCMKAEFGRGDFSVPFETVLEYNVTPKNLVALSSLVLDRTDFQKDTSGDLVNSWSYHNREFSVIISGKTRESDGEDFVGNIWFRPGRSEAEKLRCRTNK